MKIHDRRVLSLAFAALLSGLVPRPAGAACNSAYPLTYHGGYVDAWDYAKTIHYVFWGYRTYGDPQSFANTAQSIFNSPSGLPSFGIGGTRFFGVPTQYAGIDWDEYATETIPNPGGNFADVTYDDSNLPPPGQWPSHVDRYRCRE